MVLPFVAATLAFTWSLHLPVALAEHGWLTLPLPPLALLILGGYGPTLMAILLTARTHGWAGVLTLLSVVGVGLSIALILGYGPGTLSRQPSRIDPGAAIEESPAL
jgi:hypothetical protein